MLFEKTPRQPHDVRVEVGPESSTLDACGEGRWAGAGVEVETSLSDDRLSVALTSSVDDLRRVILSWRIDMPAGARVLNDHWERGYGDLEWRGVVAERCLPWYFVANDGARSCGVGVMVRPNAMCFWTVKSTKIELTLDVRNGSRGVQLAGRRLEAATVVTHTGESGQSAFDVARAFCRRMCTDPILPKEPVYGFNDWYYIYGRNTRQTVLSDAATLADLAPDDDNRPYCVIDAGWQVCGGARGGPWDRGNVLFSDMPGLAEQMRGLGVRPGIWMRLLRSNERLPDAWRRGYDRDGWMLDPSIDDVLEHVATDLRRVASDWSYELVKHDFSTYDIFGLWGFEMGDAITGASTVEFSDRSRTTAEIILAFYRKVRDACGDALVLGCNTVSHLIAGLAELQRTGDDTSGREWERTRKMGVNTLAFRMPQHGAFYAVDADCVGLTTSVPWHLNSQWLDVLARSGTPLFVSASPDALGGDRTEALREALALAAQRREVAEPLDWFDTTTPRRWKVGGEELSYDWSADS